MQNAPLCMQNTPKAGALGPTLFTLEEALLPLSQKTERQGEE